MSLQSRGESPALPSAGSDKLRFQIVQQMSLGSTALAPNFKTSVLTSEVMREGCTAVSHGDKLCFGIVASDTHSSSQIGTNEFCRVELQSEKLSSVK